MDYSAVYEAQLKFNEENIERKIKSYATKYSIQHHITVDEAYEHIAVKNYIDFLKGGR
jgi:hypothetical protein